MARDTKIRARTQEGQIELLVLINHPMETGMRKDKATGQVIPPCRCLPSGDFLLRVRDLLALLGQ